jgi:hypothetical protein
MKHTIYEAPHYAVLSASHDFLPLRPKYPPQHPGIVLGYRLDDRGSGFRFPAGAGNFTLHYRVQNGPGAHTASYRKDMRGSFPESKAAVAWSWPLASIYCRGHRMSGALHLLPQYAFIALCLVKEQGWLYLTPCSETPLICSSFCVREQVSHPYRTTVKLQFCIF